jgi:hypothetical protein
MEYWSGGGEGFRVEGRGGVQSAGCGVRRIADRLRGPAYALRFSPAGDDEDEDDPPSRRASAGKAMRTRTRRRTL